jgi:hypothetical protein
MGRCSVGLAGTRTPGRRAVGSTTLSSTSASSPSSSLPARMDVSSSSSSSRNDLRGSRSCARTCGYRRGITHATYSFLIFLGTCPSTSGTGVTSMLVSYATPPIPEPSCSSERELFVFDANLHYSNASFGLSCSAPYPAYYRTVLHLSNCCVPLSGMEPPRGMRRVTYDKDVHRYGAFYTEWRSTILTNLPCPPCYGRLVSCVAVSQVFFNSSSSTRSPA